jgi:hypothetical protein
LDVHEPEKDELTAKDFEMLRANKKAKMKEEVEQVEEGFDELMKAAKERQGPQPSGGAGVKKGTRYGGGRQKDEPESDKKKKFSEMVNLYSEAGLKTFMKHTNQVNEEPDNEQFTKEFKDQLASMEGKKKQPAVAAPATKGVKTMPEEVEQIEEGKMDHMSLSHLWHAHAKHSHLADQGYGGGSGSMHHNDHAATAIENHVRKHYGNKVADDMVTHSDHAVAHAEYVGGKEAKNVEAAAAKLRQKHKIEGNLHGINESVEKIDEREMSEPEMEKREEIVKGMKKKMAGFKERYGARAKNVMYATATKRAMGEENE